MQTSSSGRTLPALALLMLALFVAGCDELIKASQPDVQSIEEIEKVRPHEKDY